MADYSEKELNLHCDIRSVLQSHKGGLPLSRLEADFRHLIGHGIPYREFGHQTLESYLKSIPSVVYLYKNRMGTIAEAVADDSTVHIARLVERQKTSKKTRVKIESAGRRPVFNTRSTNQIRIRFPVRHSVPMETYLNRTVQQLPSCSRLGNEKPSDASLPDVKNQVPSISKNIMGKSNAKQSNDALDRKTVKPQMQNLPPRFQNLQNNGSSGANFQRQNRQLSSSVQLANCSSPIVDRKSPPYKKILEDYAMKKNLGSLIFKTLAMHINHRLIQVATVKIKEKTFSSYPLEFTNVEEAEEEAAKNAVNKLGLQNSEKKSKKKVSADINAVFIRIREILDSHPNGIINTQVPIEYSEKFNENLPDRWLDLLIQNEMIRTEKCDKERSILYPFISPYKLENDFGLAGSETSSSSDSHSTSQGYTNSHLKSTLSLPEDKYWEIFVTYITSTSDIAFRLVGSDYSEKFEEMGNEMDLCYSDVQNCIKVKNVEEGKLYAAKVDESWHRIEVKAISDNKALCTFVDHGDNEYIEVENLFVLHEDFQTLSCQVLHCQLNGLEDYASNTHGSIYLMERILGKILVAEVVSRTEPISLVLYDTSTDEDVNINQKLINFLNEDSTSKIFEEGKISKVEVIHFTNEGHVYVRPKGSCLAMFNDALQEIQDQCKNFPVPKVLSQDKLYFAKYFLDSTWYRASVINEAEGEVTVYFVDYGNVERINVNDLREMDFCRSILTNLPHQAVKCVLHQLPPDSMEWTSESFKRLDELISKNDIVLLKTIKIGNDNTPVVELFKRLESTEIVSINQTLALDIKLFKRKEIQDKEKLDATGTSIRSRISQNDAMVPLIRSCGDGDARSIPEIYSLSPPPEILNKPKFDAHVIMAVSPCNFVCQPWRSKYKLECLTLKMQLYYDNENNRVQVNASDVKIRQLFACKHHVDQLWYRVQVKGMDASGSALSVYFIDFGDTSIITCSDLQPLAVEFHDLPYQAIFCKLSGITPMDGDWRPEDCIRFQSIVVEKQFVALINDTLMDSNDAISLEVELIDTVNGLDTNIAIILLQEGRAKLCQK